LTWDHIQLILYNPLTSAEAKRRFILNLPDKMIDITFLKDLVGMRNRGRLGELGISAIANRARKLMKTTGLPDEWVIALLK
jgi:hypothetical protein